LKIKLGKTTVFEKAEFEKGWRVQLIFGDFVSGRPFSDIEEAVIEVVDRIKDYRKQGFRKGPSKATQQATKDGKHDPQSTHRA
jgi:hypothetical protein